MPIKIPATVFDGLGKWLKSGHWDEHIEHIEDLYYLHLRAYFDMHDLATFDEMSAKIGQHWGITLSNVIVMDFLSRETKPGNVIDQYLKRRGWKENAIPKAYLKAVRNSVMNLYEISDIRPGKSFLARELIFGRDPILVTERTATKNMLLWEKYAMRIVNVRGHNIIASRLLPYEPELAEQVVDEIFQRTVHFENAFGDSIKELFGHLEPKDLRPLALFMTMKLSAPLFSEAWLMDSESDQANVKLPTPVNTDVDLIRFIQPPLPI